MTEPIDHDRGQRIFERSLCWFAFSSRGFSFKSVRLLIESRMGRPYKFQQSHATIVRCHRPRSKEKRNQASSRGIKSRGTHQNRQRSYIQISFGVTVSSRTPGLTTSLSPSLLSHGIFYKPELDCVKSFRKRSWSWPS